MGLNARQTWLYPPARVWMCPFVPVWACMPGKPSFTPPSSPFRSVRAEKLAVRPWASVHVPVGARLDLYARETWPYVPGRACTCSFVPVWACTPGTPGCTSLGECTRARSCPLPLHLAVRPWTSARSCRFGPVRPENLEYARARSSRFGPVRPENLALRPWASVHVPVGARLGM